MSYLIPNLGLIAWSKAKSDPFLFCAGSINPEQEQCIQVFSFDPLNKKSHARLLGKFNTFYSVNCIAWEEHEGRQLGLISAGLSDGSVLILDPKKLIDYQMDNAQPGEDCVVSNFDLYENQQFFCMEYNCFKKGLLATGGS